jgi:hypothetical protein
VHEPTGPHDSGCSPTARGVPSPEAGSGGRFRRRPKGEGGTTPATAWPAAGQMAFAGRLNRFLGGAKHGRRVGVSMWEKKPLSILGMRAGVRQSALGRSGGRVGQAYAGPSTGLASPPDHALASGPSRARPASPRGTGAADPGPMLRSGGTPLPARGHDGASRKL